MDVRLEVDAAALYTAFSRAPERVREHLRTGLVRSARDVADHAKVHHGFTSRTGAVERSIAPGFMEPMTATVSVGSQVGAFIHSGTRPHPILPKNANLSMQRTHAGAFRLPKGSKLVLRWAVGGGFAFARFVNHPGTKPDPFLHAALAAQEGAIVTRMQGAVASALKEAGL